MEGWEVRSGRGPGRCEGWEVGVCETGSVKLEVLLKSQSWYSETTSTKHNKKSTHRMSPALLCCLKVP